LDLLTGRGFDLFFLFLGFGLTCFEELLFLLFSNLFVLPELDVLLDGLGPLVVKIASSFLVELSDDMRLVHLVLNAAALRQFKLLLDLIQTICQLYPRNNFDLVHKSNSADDNTVCISLEVEKVF
jgi:hypothetical protein